MAQELLKDFAKRQVRLKFIPNKNCSRYKNSKSKTHFTHYGQIHNVPILYANQILKDHPDKFVKARNDEVSAPAPNEVSVDFQGNPYDEPELTEEDLVDAKELMDILKISDVQDSVQDKFDNMSADIESKRAEVEAINEQDTQIADMKPVEIELDEVQGAVFSVISDAAPLKISEIAEKVGANHWRDIENVVKSLLENKLIVKTEENLYELVS